LDPRAPLVAGRKAWGKRNDYKEFQQEVNIMHELVAATREC
jgi:hypothetical protein